MECQFGVQSKFKANEITNKTIQLVRLKKQGRDVMLVKFFRTIS